MRIIKPLAALACLGLVACQSGGPSARSIVSNSSALKVAERSSNYVVVEPDVSMAILLGQSSARDGVSGFINKGSASPILIGIGDLLQISIVSTSNSGFIDFSQNSVSPISTTALPPQSVGSDGMINVPPVGRVLARGKTVQQFETFLARRLSEELIEPSVIAQLTDRRSASVSVLGQVNVPGVYSINANNGHLVEMIAEAGGPSAASQDLSVMMSRGERTGTIGLQDLYSSARSNVHMRDGDVVSVETIESAFTFLGAGGRNDTIEFNSDSISLAEALGEAQGLLNRRADRKGVFVYRNEARSALQAIDVDLSKIPGERVSVVYRFDMSDPNSLFVAKAFDIYDEDLVYVSDSIVENINAVFSAATAVVPAPAEFVRAETISSN